MLLFLNRPRASSVASPPDEVGSCWVVDFFDYCSVDVELMACVTRGGSIIPRAVGLSFIHSTKKIIPGDASDDEIESLQNRSSRFFEPPFGFPFIRRSP